MKIGDIMKLVAPWARMRLSGLTQVDKNGTRIWSNTLTEAQKYAYWNREILNHIIDDKSMTVYCIIREDK